MNTLYKIIIGVLVVCLFASVGVNLFFIKGKGISVDKSVTNHNESFSTSMSGAMIVNGESYAGNKCERRIDYFSTEEEREVFEQQLPQFSWLWMKEGTDTKGRLYVKYPYFYTVETKKNNN